ncbi:MAG TPA: polysaccharide ABC transporter ATP-binding protein [Solirubrobacteraceae bacterium]|nr:polysaccharide ABC transporter ATP-binding protein [Solirubrobacteraceae bacterium]
MGELAVDVIGVGKRYRMGAGAGYTTLREHLSTRFSSRREGRNDGEPREMWALEDVSFSMEQGDVLGIIGRNGAGKSTLLKILARITEPTVGAAHIHGRLASLLEVGTGFHEDLTGRENVFLNGVVLGMSRREIQRRFDEIVEFSGVSRFLDSPIKRYSSGMKLRLAFAVAAHLDTEIVVVDEVLAVGDSEFQRRCLGKMSDLRRSGRTVLFVSHDLGTVAQLCPRTIWLASGRIHEDGPTEQVIRSYQQSFGSVGIGARLARGADGPVRLDSARLVAPDGAALEQLRRGNPFAIEVCWTNRESLPGLDAGIYVEDARGVRALDEGLSESLDLEADLSAPGGHRLLLDVQVPLAAKEYIVGLWLGTSLEDFLNEPVLRFEIEPALEDSRDAIVKSRVLHGTGRWRVMSP